MVVTNKRHYIKVTKQKIIQKQSFQKVVNIIKYLKRCKVKRFKIMLLPIFTSAFKLIYGES